MMMLHRVESRGMSKKILLVDDAQTFLEMERSLFARTGATVLVANNGAQALRLVATERPDIVLLDQVMPDISGDVVCRRIKSDPAIASIPVLIVTARGNPDELEKCRKAGCNDILIKPIKNQDLLTKVAEHLKIPHRRSMRVLVKLELRDTDGDLSVFATSKDISAAGMFVETDQNLDVGTHIILRFFLPGQEEIVVGGEILRHEVLGTGHGYGIRFENASHQQLKLLARFIESRSR
jgi:CheY-like chemotaxis protein